MHETGCGTPPNLERALELYTQAANLGYVNAMISLGRLYESKQNWPLCKKWYANAAIKGNVLANQKLLEIVYINDKIDDSL